MDIAGIVSAYRRTLGEFEEIRVRRYARTEGENRPYFDYPCHARVTEISHVQLVGPLAMGDSVAILLAEDLIAAQFPLPLRMHDALIVRGRELDVLKPDLNTRRVGTVLVAIEVGARG